MPEVSADREQLAGATGSEAAGYAAAAFRRRLSRRAVLGNAAALAVGGAAFSALLAACGDGDDDDDSPGSGGDSSGDTSSDTDSTPSDAGDSESEEAASDEGEPEDSGDSQGDTTIRLHIVDDLLDLDPAHLGSGQDYAVAYLVYSSLIRYSPGTDQIEGDLAEEWEVSDDGLEYRFVLKQGVQWHEGYGELTADDVVFSFTRIMDEETGSRYAADFVSVESVEAVDSHEVLITMSQPDPGFIEAVLTFRPGFIVNEQALADKGDDYTNSPVGTGPYVFEGWTPGTTVELSANPDYFGGSLAIDRVVMQIIQQDTVVEIALENKEVHAAYIDDPEVQARLIEHPDLNVISRPMPRIKYININSEREPFDNPLVRQAIAYTIDRAGIVEHVLLGQGTVAHSMMNEYMFGFLDEELIPYDVELAQSLMEQAGSPDGFPDRTFDMVIYGDDDAQVAEVIQSQLSEIGINLEIQVLERALYNERQANHDFDLSISNILRTEPTQVLVPNLHSVNIPYPNISSYSGIDELLDQARFEHDDDLRRDLYEQIQRKLAEDMPVVPLLYPQQVLVTQPGVEGLEIMNRIYPLWLVSLSG